jgi:hypothetical protein
MPEELYNFLAHPEKFGGHVVKWSCESCNACNARIDQMLKGFEKRLDDVETRMGKSDDKVKDLDRRVERVEDKMETRQEEVQKKVEKGQKEIMDELREREMRKANVIMHRVPECMGEKTGKEKLAWDRMKCSEIFKALELDLTDDDIKFCRRVGEKSDETGL